MTAAKTQSFAYDVVGRLSRIDSPGSSGAKREDQLHDRNGNRVRVERRTLAADVTPASTDTYTTTAGTNRLASIASAAGTRALSYDARGNLASETRPGAITATTGYDGYARLTSYIRTGEASLSFTYNGMDDRVREVRGTATRRYVYDGSGRILGEYGASATDVIAETLWLSPEAANDNQPFGGDDGVGGYAPLAISSAPAGGTAQLLWVHANHIGVPLTYTSTSGAEVTPPSFTQNAFPGQMRTLPDLYYNRYRDYDPSTGRYLQADPIGLAGDPNPYAYAMNNPIRYSDPMGLAGGSAAGSGRAGPGGMMAGLWDWYFNHWYKPLPYPKEGVELPPETQCTFDGSILMMAKGGKQNKSNEWSDAAKRQPDPCEWLRKEAQKATDGITKRKIDTARKYLGCKRNSTQR